MPSIRFLKDYELCIVDVVLCDGKMESVERTMSVRMGQILYVESFDIQDPTVNIVFPQSSPFHGTVFNLDKSVISIDPDTPPKGVPSGGCHSC